MVLVSVVIEPQLSFTATRCLGQWHPRQRRGQVVMPEKRINLRTDMSKSQRFPYLAITHLYQNSLCRSQSHSYWP